MKCKLDEKKSTFMQILIFGLFIITSCFNSTNLVIWILKFSFCFRMKLHSGDHCNTWLVRLQNALIQSSHYDRAFAFKFYSATKQSNSELHSLFTSSQLTDLPPYDDYEARADYIFEMEVCYFFFTVPNEIFFCCQFRFHYQILWF